ncbi:MAG TPA: MAPEG family protein [Candidatus Binataceae bacterium]|nr:MAPEG family protein [Candidatus Binataceae bacterium]
MTPLKMYALTTIVLALKMAAISIAQGRARTAAGVFTNPEDAKAFGGQTATEEAPGVRRAARAWLNDLENIPIFLFLAGIYVAAGLSAGVFTIYCIVFMAARIVHTIAYLNSLQPWRTIAYVVGSLVTVALIINLFIRVVLA